MKLDRQFTNWMKAYGFELIHFAKCEGDTDFAIDPEQALLRFRESTRRTNREDSAAEEMIDRWANKT